MHKNKFLLGFLLWKDFVGSFCRSKKKDVGLNNKKKQILVELFNYRCLILEKRAAVCLAGRKKTLGVLTIRLAGSPQRQIPLRMICFPVAFKLVFNGGGGLPHLSGALALAQAFLRNVLEDSTQAGPLMEIIQIVLFGRWAF